MSQEPAHRMLRRGLTRPAGKHGTRNSPPALWLLGEIIDAVAALHASPVAKELCRALGMSTWRDVCEFRRTANWGDDAQSVVFETLVSFCNSCRGNDDNNVAATFKEVVAHVNHLADAAERRATHVEPSPFDDVHAGAYAKARSTNLVLGRHYEVRLAGLLEAEAALRATTVLHRTDEDAEEQAQDEAVAHALEPEAEEEAAQASVEAGDGRQQLKGTGQEKGARARVWAGAGKPPAHPSPHAHAGPPGSSPLQAQDQHQVASGADAHQQGQAQHQQGQKGSGGAGSSSPAIGAAVSQAVDSLISQLFGASQSQSAGGGGNGGGDSGSSGDGSGSGVDSSPPSPIIGEKEPEQGWCEPGADGSPPGGEECEEDATATGSDKQHWLTSPPPAASTSFERGGQGKAQHQRRMARGKGVAKGKAATPGTGGKGGRPATAAAGLGSKGGLATGADKENAAPPSPPTGPRPFLPLTPPGPASNPQSQPQPQPEPGTDGTAASALVHFGSSATAPPPPPPLPTGATKGVLPWDRSRHHSHASQGLPWGNGRQQQQQQEGGQQYGGAGGASAGGSAGASCWEGDWRSEPGSDSDSDSLPGLEPMDAHRHWGLPPRMSTAVLGLPVGRGQGLGDLSWAFQPYQDPEAAGAGAGGASGAGHA